MRTYFPVLATLVLPLVTRASLTAPGDVPYNQTRAGRTLYIYDADNRDVVADVAAYTEAFRERYDRSYAWLLDEEQDLILVSSRAQVANAFAMQMPNLKSRWFGAGAGELESVAGSSWLGLLAAHETAHLYQINAKAPVSRALKSVFGNTLAISPVVWPVFLLPNQTLPLSFAEGNAVLNESRFGRGGRLYSGEDRALVLRQVAAGRFDATRLINREFRFPYDYANYALGGYFQAHLAGKYGIDRTNAFFRAHADHWLNPLRLNATFRSHFGASFYREVHEATRGLERLAERQATTPGEWITPAPVVGPLNHDDARVWWLTNPGYRTYRLHVMTKADRRVTSRDAVLPLGKVFFDGDRPRSAATTPNDLHHETFGLYAENLVLEDAAGEIVTDVRGGHRVGLDARNAWRDPRVLLDGAPFDVGHSRPQLDDAGHVHYFRQHGGERLLYRDHQIVAKYDGVYGKITEVGPAGEVFFVAATAYGSSLFRHADGEITRVVASDSVVDARVLDARTVLVREVDADGGHLVVAARLSTNERPAVYAYPFPTEPVRLKPTLEDARRARDERPYAGLRELRFSEASLGLSFDSFGGAGAAASLSFTDPLEFHAIGATAFYSAFGTRTAAASYVFSRYLPFYYGQYTYGDWRYRTLDGSARVIDQEADVGVRVGVLRHAIFDANLDAAAVLAQRGAGPGWTRARDGAGAFVGVTAQRAIASPLGLYPWRLLRATLTHRALFDPSRGRETERAGGVRLEWTHGFAGQFYLAATGRAAAGDERSVNVGYDVDLMPTSVGVARLGVGPLLAARSAGSVRLEGRRVFGDRWYDDRIPIGINRAAVVLAAQATGAGQTGAGAPKSITEYGVGLDLDLLLFHLSPLVTRVMGVRVSDAAYGDPDLQIVAGVSGAF